MSITQSDAQGLLNSGLISMGSHGPARDAAVLIAAARMWTLRGKPGHAAGWLGLVENHTDPAIKMTDIQRDVQVARGECEAALSPEPFAASWEEGKSLDLDSVVVDILSEL